MRKDKLNYFFVLLIIFEKRNNIQTVSVGRLKAPFSIIL